MIFGAAEKTARSLIARLPLEVLWAMSAALGFVDALGGAEYRRQAAEVARHLAKIKANEKEAEAD